MVVHVQERVCSTTPVISGDAQQKVSTAEFIDLNLNLGVKMEIYPREFLRHTTPERTRICSLSLTQSG